MEQPCIKHAEKATSRKRFTSSYYLSKGIFNRDKKQYYWPLILTQGTCYENFRHRTYKMNNEWIKFSCLAEKILTNLNLSIRLRLFYRQNIGILNYDSFIQDFVEKSVATVFVCTRAQKDLKRAGCSIHFKFSQPHARLVWMSTYKYFCPPDLCSGLRDVSQPFTEKEKIDYPRKKLAFLHFL